MPDPLATPLAILSALHGDLDVLQLELKRGCVHIYARSKAPVPTCPCCKTRSDQAHGSYVRTLDDLGYQGTPVRLHLRVRRFRCVAPRCPRTTFSEQLPLLALAHARRTTRMTRLLGEIGMALGGEAGARLLSILGVCASADTLLRVVRRMPTPTRATPRVLGVDEWAWRKGHVYGTILIDLERHVVVDVLPERSAENFADWLARHPGVEIIARDRSELYAGGARRGAPEALQVADRWYLLKNMGDMLERVLQRHRSDLEQIAAETVCPVSAPPIREGPPAATEPAATPAATPPPEPSSTPTKGHLPRQTWNAQIHALRGKSLSIHAISKTLHLSRPTVRKYLNAPTCPTRASRRTKVGAMTGFDAHLQTRWADGCHDAVTLWRELRARGFHGSYRTVQRHVARWREALPTFSTSTKTPSPRQVRWWLLLPEARRSPSQNTFVQALTAKCESVRTAQVQALEFGRLLRAHDVAAWVSWLVAASGSPLKKLRDFAAGLRRDGSGVLAAVEQPWSNGQTEGQVNRLKLLKRQMYGRASFALLRQRVLHAA